MKGRKLSPDLTSEYARINIFEYVGDGRYVQNMAKIIPAPPIEKLLKKEHDDKWVAFSCDYKKIVDYSKSLEDLQKKIGGEKVIYYKAYPSDLIFAPHSQMWVQFRYDSNRPLLSVKLVNPANGKEFNCLALVDSGATMSLANAEIAKALEIDLNKYKDRDVGGIKETSKGKILEKMDLCVQYLPKELTIPMMFVEGLRTDVLLGQIGFFDSYRITFQKDSGFFQIMKSSSTQYDKK